MMQKNLQENFHHLLEEPDFWSIMENEQAHAHLQKEAHQAADLIQKSGPPKRFRLDRLPCSHFWTLMENPIVDAHIKEQANKVVEMINQSALSQKQPTLEEPCENFWTIMDNPLLRAHIKEQAHKAAAQVKISQLNKLVHGFWSLMENPIIFAHVNEQANKVVAMVSHEREVFKVSSIIPCFSDTDQTSASSQMKPFSEKPEENKPSVQSLAQVKSEVIHPISEPREERNFPCTDSQKVKPLSPKSKENKRSEAVPKAPCGQIKPNSAKNKKDVPYTSSKKSLEQIFKLLSSDDWEKKVNGLTSVQDLSRHRPEDLTADLRKLCVAVVEEVKNLRSVVSGAAMSALAVMYAHLDRAMDRTLAQTGRALLQKLSDTNLFLRQRANQALAAMVEHCSPRPVLTLLESAGLSHRCAAVRASAALNLQLLLDVLGPTRALTADKAFTKQFLLALSRVLQDGCEDARKHGHSVYREISVHGDFPKLWKSAVPEKARRSVEGLVKKSFK